MNSRCLSVRSMIGMITTKATPLSLMLVSLLAGGLYIANAGQGTGQGPGQGAGQGIARRMAGPPNPVTFVKRALEGANAPALTTQQEEQLTQLITNFRETRQAQTPDDSVKAAHDAYDAAILAGDEATAQAQAAVLASALAAQNASRLKAEASFKIAALAVLSSEQKTALSNDGLTRLISALAGGPGRGFGGRLGPADDSMPPPAMMRRRPGN